MQIPKTSEGKIQVLKLHGVKSEHLQILRV